MKHQPFYLKLALLLKCSRCKTEKADPGTGLCRKCEIKKLYSDSKRGK